MTLPSKTIQSLQSAVINWQRSHGRHQLPWQQDITPYRVHVSEIMLQQTQVTTVIPYFQRWMQRFPDLTALAAASEDDVMALWQGLGYYSRARNLRKAAQHIVTEHQGHYPNDLQALIAIPGIGRYTAGAIRSFAFQDYGPIVDGNVKRLYARLFAIYGDPSSSAVVKAMWQYAEALTPNSKASAQYSQGVLDLGATLCKKHTPDCPACPLQSHCVAYQENKIASLPSPKPRKPKPQKEGHFIWQREARSILLCKRPGSGIWGGLWCLPQLTEAPQTGHLVGEFTHEFTHYRLHAKVWQANDNLLSEAARYTPTVACQPQHEGQLSELGLPTPIKHFITDKLVLDD